MGSRNLTEMIRTQNRHLHAKGLREAAFCKVVNRALHSDLYEHSPRYEGTRVRTYEDLNRLDADVLSEILIGIAIPNPERIDKNRKSWAKNVAPADLIIGDYNLFDTWLLDGYAALNKEDMNLMACLGHAANGHCAFRKHGKFPNTTIDDILGALRNNTKKLTNPELYSFSSRCQENIDTNAQMIIFDFYEGNNYRKKHRPLVDGDGFPMGRIKALNGFYAYTISNERGYMFTGHMDTEQVRNKVFEKYGYQMATGETFAVDRDLLKGLNIGLDDLAKAEYKYGFLNHLTPDKRIEVFRKAGIIVSKPVEDSELHPEMSWRDAKEQHGINTAIDDRDIILAYIRSVKGLGVADDIGIFLSAFLIPFPHQDEKFPLQNGLKSQLMSRLIGGAAADWNDTREKYSNIIVEGGQDNLSARIMDMKFNWSCRTNPEFRKIYDIPFRPNDDYTLVDPEVIIDYTFASAKIWIDIHSSMRYQFKGYSFDNKSGRNGDSKNKSQGNNKAKPNNKETTCMSYQIISHAAEIANDLSIPCTSLYHGKNAHPADMPVGFHQIPLKTVSDVMLYRLGLVIDPTEREDNLRWFSEKIKKSDRSIELSN